MICNDPCGNEDEYPNSVIGLNPGDRLALILVRQRLQEMV